ncbi:MAG: T9SS type A sorting domain-containing protein, partial [Bacteroidota bacterium]
VILRRYSSEVIYGTGDLSSISITNAMAFSNENIDIRPGDIDGDNDIDLFNNRTNDGSGWTTLPYRKYLNQGSATFNLVTENIPLGERQSQFMSDVDRDNDLDLLYVTSDRKIHYLLNQVTSLIADTTEIEVNDNVQFTYQIADMGTTNELRFGDGNTMNLTTSSGTISHAYSNEGVYYVSIYIDNVLADKIAILVKSCDFSGFVSSTNGYREANEERCDFIQSGVARIPPALSSVSYYWTNLNSFKNFNLSGDNAGMEVRVKNPSSGGGISCYDTRIVIYGDQGVAQVSFMTTGCSFYSSMTAGNTSVNGSNTNLTALAQNLSNWHTIKLETQNDTAKAFYDGDEKYALNYTGMVGNILGVRVTFKGSGSVDWIKLYDGTGSIAFEEEFDECSQTYYADTDGDSYGDPNVSLQSCESPIGYVTNADDCDDSDPNLNIQNGCTTCNDGIQNGDETGVDCGGSCPPCTGNNNCPDLIFENITFNNSTSYSYTFKNIGYSNIDLFGSGSTYSDNIVIQNILSLDSIYGNADDFGGGGSVIPGPPGTILTPGDTYSGNYQLALNGNTANYAFIIIDWGNKFLECFEDNNVVVIPLNGSRAWDQCDFINLNINHNPILSSTYKVQNSIVSDGKIYPSAIVTFQAENDILLKPGFQATEGSDFHGFLSACNLPSLFTIPADSSSTLENNTTKDRTNRQGDYPRLDQNIPNPFRSTTIIPYYVPLKSRSAQINIYNILGQFVGTQKIQNFGEGYVEYTINNLPDGIYFYALIVDKKIMGVKKMTIQNE